MPIRQIDPGRARDVAQFVQFPFELYRDQPLWSPMLTSDLENVVRGRHPFFRHSTADFFVYERDGRILGRIALLENRNFNRYQGRRAAFFGYFEVVEELEVARSLFITAFHWARDRDLDEIVGPRGVMGTDGSVLVEGFEHRPAMGIPYNPPYYDDFIRNSGFAKDTDYLSAYFRPGQILPERIHRIAHRVKRRNGFWIKSFRNKREIRRWVPRALAVHQVAMKGLHTYYPPTGEEVAMVIDSLLIIADPGLIKLIMRDDEVVGFILGYPDITPTFRRIEGRLLPTGWFHLWRALRNTRYACLNGLGLLPEYQGLGANALLYAELEKTLQASRYEHVDLIQANENNFQSRSDMETVGVNWYKRHRHYVRPL